jgi:hypothetical protein
MSHPPDRQYVFPLATLLLLVFAAVSFFGVTKTTEHNDGMAYAAGPTQPRCAG